MSSDTEQPILCREATVADIPALAELRWQMEVERHGAQFPLEVYTEAFDRAMRADMERGSGRAWVAESDGALIACVVLMWSPTPPHFEHMSRRRGFVSSVYTCPEYRRRGIGRRLMQTLIAASREMNITRLVLWASDMGRPLYEELGFIPSHGMELNL
jgi:GNAT superfamily N-acetyltransferase